jgi:hypothetical protein
MTDTHETQLLPRAVVGSVTIAALLLVIGSLAWPVMVSVSVALGGAVALLHLWSVAHWVKRAFGGQTVRLTWIVFSFLKLGLLFAGLAWLARNDVIGVLPFLIGYAALPLGILMGQLLGPLWLVLAPHTQQPDRERSSKAKG